MTTFTTAISNEYPDILTTLSENKLDDYMTALNHLKKIYEIYTFIRALPDTEDGIVSQEVFLANKDKWIHLGNYLKNFLNTLEIAESHAPVDNSPFFNALSITPYVHILKKMLPYEGEEEIITLADYFIEILDEFYSAFENIIKFFSNFKTWLTSELKALLNQTYKTQEIVFWIKELKKNSCFFSHTADIAIFVQFPAIKLEFELTGLYFNLENNLPIPQFDHLELKSNINELKNTFLERGIADLISDNFSALKIKEPHLDLSRQAEGIIGPFSFDLEADIVDFFPPVILKNIRVYSTGKILPPERVLGGDNTIITLPPISPFALHGYTYDMAFKDKSFTFTTALAPESPLPPKNYLYLDSSITVFTEKFLVYFNGDAYIFKKPIFHLEAQFSFSPFLIKGSYTLPHSDSPGYLKEIIKSNGIIVIGKELNKAAGIYLHGKTEILNGLVFDAEMDLNLETKELKIRNKNSLNLGIRLHQDLALTIFFSSNSAKLFGHFSAELDLSLKIPETNIELFSARCYLIIDIQQDDIISITIRAKIPNLPEVIVKMSTINFNDLKTMLEKKYSTQTKNYYNMILEKIRNLEKEINKELAQCERKFKDGIYNKAKDFGIDDIDSTGNLEIDEFLGDIAREGKNAGAALANMGKKAKKVISDFLSGNWAGGLWGSRHHDNEHLSDGQKQDIINSSFYNDFNNLLKKIEVSEINLGDNINFLRIKFLYPSVSALNLSNGVVCFFCQLDYYQEGKEYYSINFNLKIYLNNCYAFDEDHLITLLDKQAWTFKIDIEAVDLSYLEKFKVHDYVYGRVYDIMCTTFLYANVVNEAKRKFYNRRAILLNNTDKSLNIHFQYEEIFRNKIGFWQPNPVPVNEGRHALARASYSESSSMRQLAPGAQTSVDAARIRYWCIDNAGNIVNNNFYFKDLNLMPADPALGEERAYVANDIEEIICNLSSS